MESADTIVHTVNFDFIHVGLSVVIILLVILCLWRISNIKFPVSMVRTSIAAQPLPLPPAVRETRHAVVNNNNNTANSARRYSLV